MYVIDDQASFDAALARLSVIPVVPSPLPKPLPQFVDHPANGIRDTEHPCDCFHRGRAGHGECYGDGHYGCYYCGHLSSDSPLLDDEEDERYAIV